MIIVSVILLSAQTGDATELARMSICNTGAGSPTLGNYEGKTFTGRNTEVLSKGKINRTAVVTNYPRQAIHVWNLVARMLTAMGYK